MLLPLVLKVGFCWLGHMVWDLECFSITVNTINAWCYFDPPNKLWLLTCIYGLLERKNKSGFWDSFLNEGKDYYGPWLCIGDFR
jgi:hypothetical protein